MQNSRTFLWGGPLAPTPSVKWTGWAATWEKFIKVWPVISPSLSGPFISVATLVALRLCKVLLECFFFLITFHHPSGKWVRWSALLSLLHKWGNWGPGWLSVLSAGEVASRWNCVSLLLWFLFLWVRGVQLMQNRGLLHALSTSARLDLCPFIRLVLLGFNWWLLGTGLLGSRFPLGHCF